MQTIATSGATNQFVNALSNAGVSRERFAECVSAVSDYMSVSLQASMQSHLKRINKGRDPDVQNFPEFIKAVMDLYAEKHKKMPIDCPLAKEILEILVKEGIHNKQNLDFRLEVARFSDLKQLDLASLHVSRAQRACVHLDFKRNVPTFIAETNIGELESLKVCLSRPNIVYDSQDADTRELILPTELLFLESNFSNIESIGLEYPSAVAKDLALDTKRNLLRFKADPTSHIKVYASGLNAIAYASPERLAHLFERVYSRVLEELGSALENHNVSRSDLEGDKIYATLTDVAPTFYALMRSCGLIPWLNRKVVYRDHRKSVDKDLLFGLAPEAQGFNDAIARSLALLNILIQQHNPPLCYVDLFLEKPGSPGSLRQLKSGVPIKVVRNIDAAIADVRALI